MNYTATKKELLTVVFALDKFRPYILGLHVVIFPDYSALNNLVSKKDMKPQLIFEYCYYKESDIEIHDKKKGVEKVVAGHLSYLQFEHDIVPFKDLLPNEQLFVESSKSCYASKVNFIVEGKMSNTRMHKTSDDFSRR